MTKKQILKSSAVLALGFLQFAPVVFVFSSTIIACVLGIFYACALVWFWSSTIIGRKYFRALWREILRLENVMHLSTRGSREVR